MKAKKGNKMTKNQDKKNYLEKKTLSENKKNT